MTAAVWRLDVSWSASANATSYRVQWKGPGESYSIERTALAISTSYAIRTRPGANYTVKVTPYRNSVSGPGAEKTAWSVGAYLFDVRPSTLTEAAIAAGNARVSVAVYGFELPDESGVSVAVHGPSGVGVAQKSVVDGDVVNVDLSMASGADFDTDGTLSVTVTFSGRSLTTQAVPVKATLERPAALAGLTVTAAEWRLDVSWSASAGADSYRVQWKGSNALYSTVSRIATTTTTTYSISVPPGVPYTVKVTPYGSGTPGPAAEKTGASVGAFISQLSPSPLTEAAIGAGEAIVDVGVAGFTFPDSGGSVSVAGPSGVSIARHTVLDEGESVAVYLEMDEGGDFDTDGTLSVTLTFSGRSLTTQAVRVTAREEGAAALSGLTLTAAEWRLDVSWSASTDADSYRVQWKGSNALYSTVSRIATTTATTYSISAPPGVRYTVKVTPYGNDVPGAAAETTGSSVGAFISQLSPSPLTEEAIVAGEAIVDVGVAGFTFPASGGSVSMAGPSGVSIARHTVLDEGESVAVYLEMDEGGDFDTEGTLSVTLTFSGRSLTTQTVRVIATVERAAALTGLTVTAAEWRLDVNWSASAYADSYRVQWKSAGQSYSSVVRTATTTSTSYSIHATPEVSTTVKVTPYAGEVAGPAAETTGSSVGAYIYESNPSTLTETALVAGTASVSVAVPGFDFPAQDSGVSVSVEGPSGVGVARKTVIDVDAVVVDLEMAEGADFDTDGTLSATVDFSGHSLTTQTVPVVATVEPVTTATSTAAALTGLTVAAADWRLDVSWSALADADSYRVQWKDNWQAYSDVERTATSTSTSYSIGMRPGVNTTVKVTPYTAGVAGLAAEQTGSSVGAVIGQTSPAPLTEDAIAAGEAIVAVGLVGFALPSDANFSVSVQGPNGIGVAERTVLDRQHLAVRLAMDKGADIDADATLRTTVTFSGRLLKTQAVQVVATDEATPGQVTSVVVDAGVLSLDVAWNQVHDATSYKVQWRDGTQAWGSTGAGVGQLVVANASTTIRSLTASTTYAVRVVATKARATDGLPSDEHTGTPRAAALELKAADLIANGLDEGETKTYTVALTAAPPEDVMVTIASDHATVVPVPARLTFSTSTWQVARTVAVKSAEDDNALHERVALTHDPSSRDYSSEEITFSVKDDDEIALLLDTAPTVSGDQRAALALTEGDPRASAKTYTVRLASAPTTAIDVAVASDNLAAVVATPTRLTFSTSTWDIAQTVTATAQDDLDRADARVTLSHTSSGDYEAAPADVRVDVTDNVGAAVSVGTESLALREGGAATYAVALDMQPTGSVTIAGHIDGSSTLTLAPPALTFSTTDWATSRFFTVRAADDPNTSAERGTVRHVARGGGYDGVAIPSVSIAVAADDPAARLLLDSASLAVTAGGAATYGVALAARPTAPVRVSIAATGPISASPAALVFGTDAWNLTQTVRVRASLNVAEDGAAATLSHAASGGGYDGQRANLPVRVSRASHGVSANVATLAVAEGEQTSYELRLNTRPAGAVTVTVSASSAAAYTVPAAVTFPPENWDRPISVTVHAVADGDLEDETVVLAHAVTGYHDITVGPVLVVTVDDGRSLLPTLRSLAVLPGELRPAFAPDVFDYTARVARDVAHVTVTATAESRSADVVIATPDASPAPGHQVALAGGANEVVVRLVDAGQVCEYGLQIVRAASRRPRTADALAPMAMEVGVTKSIDVSAGFNDPDGDPLTYAASSDAPTVATVEVSGAEARVTGRAEGGAMISVYATDPTGLTASQTLPVAVGNVVQFAETAVSVVEGATAILTATLRRAKRLRTPLTLSIRPDEHDHTHDADHHDYHTDELTMVIPAGRKSATVGLGIHDDEHIEPLRESFVVALVAQDDVPLGPARTATVTIHEGICDRMTRMQEAMTLHEGNSCASVTAKDLARQDTLDLSRCHGCVLRLGDLHGFANLRELSLAGNGLKTLPSRVFAGLSKLRVLDLSNNQLSTLPPGLFEGLAELAEVDLSDNPGAPFTLAVDLVRQDAEPSQPTAATVALHVAEGAPFPMHARVAMRDAQAANEDRAVLEASIAPGQVAGVPFDVRPVASHAAWLWPVAAPPVPSSRCRGVPCYRGIRTAIGMPLALFEPALSDFIAPDIQEPLAEGDWMLALDDVFGDLAGDRSFGFEATSSEVSLATVAVRAGQLVVSPSPGGEGLVTITVTATDGASAVSTLRFTIRVDFGLRPFVHGWRLVLHDLAEVPHRVAAARP